MTVSELIAQLRHLPDDAQVVVDYDAGCCRDEDLEVLSEGGTVVIRTDAGLFRR